MKIVNSLCLLMTALYLAACGGSTPSSTVVELTVTAAAGVNPAPPDGRPSPVLVRVYGLASANAFTSADFYQLHQDPSAVLGQDLAGQDEFVVMPGGRESVVLELAPSTRYLGIVAAYRAIDRATWQALAPVRQSRTTSVQASLEPLEVKLAPARGGS